MEIVNQIVMRKISEVRPYVRNPRKNDKTVNLLVEIIPKVGFNVPLVIDRAGVIVKGHARYAAAIRLGMQEIPCVVTDADEETIKLDRLADNRISEFSEWIDEDLLHEVDMLNLDFDFDLDALGFSVPSDSFAEDFLNRIWVAHRVSRIAIVVPDMLLILKAQQRKKLRMLRLLHKSNWIRLRHPQLR